MIWEHWKFERGVWRTFVGLKLETESNVPNDVFREASQVALIVGPGNRSRKMLAQEWLSSIFTQVFRSITRTLPVGGNGNVARD
jgi:hypothetical protein